MLFHGVLGSKLVLYWYAYQVQNSDLSHYTLYGASSTGHSDHTPESYRHTAKKRKSNR